MGLVKLTSIIDSYIDEVKDVEIWLSNDFIAKGKIVARGDDYIELFSEIKGIVKHTLLIPLDKILGVKTEKRMGE